MVVLIVCLSTITSYTLLEFTTYANTLRWSLSDAFGQERIKTGAGEEERVTLIGACSVGRIFER